METIHVPNITNISQADTDNEKIFAAKEIERGFMLDIGLESFGEEKSQLYFIAEDRATAHLWMDGLVLICGLEGKESPGLIQEIMDLFVVKTELEILAKEKEQKPQVPIRPENLNFVGSHIPTRAK